MEIAQTKVYQKNNNLGDHQLPEVLPTKEIRGKLIFHFAILIGGFHPELSLLCLPLAFPVTIYSHLFVFAQM